MIQNYNKKDQLIVCILKFIDCKQQNCLWAQGHTITWCSLVCGCLGWTGHDSKLTENESRSRENRDLKFSSQLVASDLIS